MSSWLPYDEARLHALVGTYRAELSGWLNDRRSLGALARRRGHASLRALAGRLRRPAAGRRVAAAAGGAPAPGVPVPPARDGVAFAR